MNKLAKFTLLLLLSSTLLTSCYTFTATVGKGAQTGSVITKKNHYLLGGLVAIKPVDARQIAGTTENYNITVTHKFVDGLIASLTMGIYTPTTTIITK